MLVYMWNVNWFLLYCPRMSGVLYRVYFQVHLLNLRLTGFLYSQLDYSRLLIIKPYSYCLGEFALLFCFGARHSNILNTLGILISLPCETYCVNVLSVKVITLNVWKLTIKMYFQQKLLNLTCKTTEKHAFRKIIEFNLRNITDQCTFWKN